MTTAHPIETEVSRGRRYVFSRARRPGDGASVILKTLRDEFPTASQAAGLRREYELLRDLELPGVARALDLVTHRDRPALILEDVPGDPLQRQIPTNGMPLERFFPVALALTATLGSIHRLGIVHRDLNPHNVLFDPPTGRLTVIDFETATRLTVGRMDVRSPGAIEGTIAYMSPEQTGRMNRDFDYRTDFYSLGVTFYELLTGALPFPSADPLEVIHGHIARTPQAPHEIEARVPVPISALVMKLLSKSPEDRYQSARGLEADLEAARSRWESTGEVGTLDLGETDFSEHFTIPEKLYGRERELQALKVSFDRVCEGASGLALISGTSGIGKTSLVLELQRSLACRSAQFASGKFDQLGRDVPLSAIVQALRSVVRHWLTESEARVRERGQRIRDAVGANGRLLTDVIPELEGIIGTQPEVAPLGVADAQNRFHLTMRRFLGVAARSEHPLILFLDDLQWADLATLSLVPLLLSGPESHGLLLVGAYRDQETPERERIEALRTELRERNVRIDEIALEALDRPSLEAFVADALHASREDVRELAALVESKTAGNPFFVTRFLVTLHESGLLSFDPRRRCWAADLASIRDQNLTDNVLELMSSQIRKMAAETRDVLCLAACVGARFDLGTLATIRECAPSAVAEQLWEGISRGLVRVDSGAAELWTQSDPGTDPALVQFRFLHDRVQQAAYEQIPTSARPAMHLRVGRLLLARGGHRFAETIFEVVHHLNVGRDLMGDPEERLRLAELNLEAGRRARVSGAYASASAHLAIGASLITEKNWAEHGPLAFALHLDRCDAEYLCGRFADAEAGLRALLLRSRFPLETAEVRLRQITLCETMSRYADAIAAGMAGLDALGMPIPETRADQDAALQVDLDAIARLRAGRPIASLIDLPRLSNPVVRTAMRLLMSIWAPAYTAGHETLRCLAAGRMVRLSLQHGNCEESAFGYLHHGIAVGYTLGDYLQGFEFGQLGLALNERLADSQLDSVVHHRFAAFLNLWTRPFETCIASARRAVRSGIESGHPQIVAYALFQQSWYAMQLDSDLDRFEQTCLPSIRALAELQNPAFLEAQRLIRQWGQALAGKTAAPTDLTSADFDERSFLDRIGEKGIFRGLYATIRLELLDTFQHVEEARRAAVAGESAAELYAASIWPALFAFRSVLALCAWLPGAPPDERANTLARLDLLEARLRRWAANASENFGHWHRLACAEIARVRGTHGVAMEHYESAIALAERQVSPRHRALANELYGRFWLDLGQPRFARVLLQEARFGYEQWGALAKVREMDRRYAEVMNGAETMASASDPNGAQHPPPGSGGRLGALDAIALARAGRVLSGEIELSRVLEELLRIVLQTGGATRACLVLDRNGEWRVEAEGETDPPRTEVLHGRALGECDTLPASILNFVLRSGETLALDDAALESEFRGDPYLANSGPRSLLCTPITGQSRRIGLLYLENRVARAAFTPDRVEMLQLLSAQAAISIQNAELFAEVRRLHERARAENVYLHEEIKTRHGFEEIVGRSPALKRVLKQVEQVAESDATVLIAGETGTGKELIARAIHRLSARRDRPMITVNCGAISPGLVESELFGHEKGAFTGAVARKIGRFEVADGGTLFLDEIGDLAPELQVKLLRALQEGEIERLGSTKPIRVNVRVVAATHRDLAQRVHEGRFREDLFYRLNVFPIAMPPLRERAEDIPLLVRYFAIRNGIKLGKRIESFPKRVLDELTAYAWPGNVRELANLIERSVIVSPGPVLELREWSPGPALGTAASASQRLEDVEREHIVAALARSGWRVSGPRGAARVLGLKPTTLEARMKRLGIHRPI